MGYKDQVKRDIQAWRNTTRRVFFDVLKGVPEDVKQAALFDMDDEKLNDISTHQNEELIRKTIEGMVEIMERRKELLQEFAEIAGASEHLSELDLAWVLRYGIEMYGGAVKEAFAEERTRVFTRMMTAGFTNRVNSVLSGGFTSSNGENTQDLSE